MRNHGPFTIGANARDAVKAAVMVEDVARTVHLAREAGPLVPIPQDAIDSPLRPLPERVRPGARRPPQRHRSGARRRPPEDHGDGDRRRLREDPEGGADARRKVADRR